MLRADQKLLAKSGEASLDVQGIRTAEGARLHYHLGGAATALEKAVRETELAVAAHASAKKRVTQAPGLLAAQVRAVVVAVGLLKRGVTIPEESPFDSRDPIVRAEEVAEALEGGDPVLGALAEALRSAAADYGRLLEAYEAAVTRMQTALHDHETARKELMALTSKAQALITRATPIEAFGRQFRRRPVRRPLPVAPMPPTAQRAAGVPMLSHGATAGASIGVSPAVASPPAPRPAVSTPAPSNGTPAGASIGVSPAVASLPAPRPAVSTPAPSNGTPAGASIGVSPAVASPPAPRPAVSAPAPSNGTPAGASTSVSPEVVGPPTPPD